MRARMLFCLVCFACLPGANSQWLFAAADIYTTLIPSRLPGNTLLNADGPLAELAFDFSDRLCEFGAAATETMATVAAALGGQVEVLMQNAPRLFGEAAEDYGWAIMDKTYTSSPHKFIVLLVGETLEALNKARASSKAALRNAAPSLSGWSAALLLTASVASSISAVGVFRKLAMTPEAAIETAGLPAPQPTAAVPPAPSSKGYSPTAVPAAASSTFGSPMRQVSLNMPSLSELEHASPLEQKTTPRSRTDTKSNLRTAVRMKFKEAGESYRTEVLTKLGLQWEPQTSAGKARSSGNHFTFPDWKMIADEIGL